MGFLGLHHMETVQERLEREYNLSLITTAPSVAYKVTCVNGETVQCSNPSLLPEAGIIKSIEEPFVKIEMLTPKDYIGALMELAQDRRGEFKELKFITEITASIVYELPLAEMGGDFFEQLKSRSRGCASMEYSFIGYKESDAIKLEIQTNGEPVEPLATKVHKDKVPMSLVLRRVTVASVMAIITFFFFYMLIMGSTSHSLVSTRLTVHRKLMNSISSPFITGSHDHKDFRVDKGQPGGKRDPNRKKIRPHLKTRESDHLLTILGYSVTSIQFLVGLASVPTAWHIYRDRSTVGYPIIPHVIELFPTIMLMYHDILDSQPRVSAFEALQICADVFRCIAEVMYIIMYMYFAVHNDRILAIILAMILVLCLATSIAAVNILVSGNAILKVVGFLYQGGWVASIFGPLGHIRELRRTRNLNMFPIVLTCFQTLDGVVWMINAHFCGDPFFVIPNVGGVLFGSVQIGVYMYFYIRQLAQLEEVDTELQHILPEPEPDSSSDFELDYLPSPPAEPEPDSSDFELDYLPSPPAEPEPDSSSDFELHSLPSPPAEPMDPSPAEDVAPSPTRVPAEAVAPPVAPLMPLARIEPQEESNINFIIFLLAFLTIVMIEWML